MNNTCLADISCRNNTNDISKSCLKRLEKLGNIILDPVHGSHDFRRNIVYSLVITCTIIILDSRFTHVHVHEYIHYHTRFKPLPLVAELRATTFLTNRVGASLTRMAPHSYRVLGRLIVGTAGADDRRAVNYVGAGDESGALTRGMLPTCDGETESNRDRTTMSTYDQGAGR